MNAIETQSTGTIPFRRGKAFRICCTTLGAALVLLALALHLMGVPSTLMGLGLGLLGGINLAIGLDW